MTCRVVSLRLVLLPSDQSLCLSLSPPAASQLLLARASHALEQVAVEMRFPDFITRRFQTKLSADQTVRSKSN